MALEPGIEGGVIPGKVKISRNTDFRYLITGIPYQITGFSYDAGLYSKIDSSLIDSFTVQLENDPAGLDSKILLSLTKANVNALVDQNYNISIKQTDTTGYISPFISGLVSIVAEKDV